jgi:hypothetical protein
MSGLVCTFCNPKLRTMLVGELTESLRAVPDPEECCKVDTGYTFDPKRVLIRYSILGSLCKLPDENLRFALEEKPVDAKECIFYLCISGGQRTPDTLGTP